MSGAPWERFIVTVYPGEAGTVYNVVDRAQPDPEQPCVVASWSSVTERNAAYLARDYCARHNDERRTTCPICHRPLPVCEC